MTSALCGQPLASRYSIAGVSDLTGGAGAGVDTRVDLSLRSEPLRAATAAPSRRSTPSVVRPPSDPNRVGTARGDEFVGPGYLNWDISFLKNIPLGGTRRLQFRCELYNAFNNVQFSNVNTSATFNAGRPADQSGVRLVHGGARRAADSVHVEGAILVWRQPPSAAARGQC